MRDVLRLFNFFSACARWKVVTDDKLRITSGLRLSYWVESAVNQKNYNDVIICQNDVINKPFWLHRISLLKFK